MHFIRLFILYTQDFWLGWKKNKTSIFLLVLKISKYVSIYLNWTDHYNGLCIPISKWFWQNPSLKKGLKTKFYGSYVLPLPLYLLHYTGWFKHCYLKREPVTKTSINIEFFKENQGWEDNVGKFIVVFIKSV